MAFQYWTGAAWADIPDAAMAGTYGGDCRLVYPRAGERDGTGAPCGAIGLPYVIITTPRMTGTGMAHWTAKFASIAAESATYDIKIINERDASTDSMSGTLLWPIYKSVSVGSTAAKTIYHGVEIHIENCTTSSH